MMGKISFMGRTHVPENQMFWRNISLFDLKYQAAYTSYQKMIKNAGIMDDFNKRTHMRYVDVAVVLQTNLLRVHVDVINTCCSLHQFYTNYYAYREQGCKFCTAQGLTDEQVKTISKHQTSDIFSKSYRSEVSIPVMVCLAGFVPNVNVESYFVPRAAIQLPHSMAGPVISRNKFKIKRVSKWGLNPTPFRLDETVSEGGQNICVTLPFRSSRRRSSKCRSVLPCDMTHLPSMPPRQMPPHTR